MRSVLVSALLTLTVAATGHAQNYALFSPAAARGFAAERDSAAARNVIHTAQAALIAQPHAMPVVHTEGTLPGAGIHDESAIAQRDWPAIESLAFAYRLTGDKTYLAGVARYLDAWFPLYKPGGDPIDETSMDHISIALDLTRGDLPAATETHTLDFLRAQSVRYLDWLDAHYSSDKDNWSSHRVKLALYGAYESGEQALIARATSAFTRQLKQNIREDGMVDDFPKRDALHYVIYDLEPLVMAALAGRAHGHDWFHATIGPASLEKCMDWLTPYATGQTKHDEFVHSSVPFDAKRAAAGLKGYSGPWSPASSVELYTMATWLDPKYLKVLTAVEDKSGKGTPPWIVLAIGDKDALTQPKPVV